MDWLYGIQSGLFIKVGVANNINDRLRTMNLYNPHPCKVVAKRRIECAYHAERRVHQILKPYAIGREWFAVDAPLVRAAMTIAIRDVRREHQDWIDECNRREELKHSRKVLKGLVVDSDDAKIIPLKKQANS